MRLTLFGKGVHGTDAPTFALPGAHTTSVYIDSDGGQVMVHGITPAQLHDAIGCTRDAAELPFLRDLEEAAIQISGLARDDDLSGKTFYEVVEAMRNAIAALDAIRHPDDAVDRAGYSGLTFHQRQQFNALPPHIDDRAGVDCGPRCPKCNFLRAVAAGRKPCADCDSGAENIPPHDCTKYDREPAR